MTRRGSFFTAGAVVFLLAADAPKPVWTTDLSKMKAPDAPASGKIQGLDFTVEKAMFDPIVSTIKLRQGKNFFPDAEIIVFLFLKKDEALEGKTYEIGLDSKFDVLRPHVHLSRIVPNEKLPKSISFADKYAMKLELGAKKDGKIPGKIYVCLPDDDKSFVAGTFIVDVK